MTIPPYMKPWAGGDAAPDDYDGGRVMLANGKIEKAEKGLEFFWGRDEFDPETDIIAYEPRAQQSGSGADVRFADATPRPWICDPVHNDRIAQVKEEFIWTVVDGLKQEDAALIVYAVNNIEARDAEIAALKVANKDFNQEVFARRIAHTQMCARIAELEGALKWIESEYANQNMSHVDFRVIAYQRAIEALKGGAE